VRIERHDVVQAQEEEGRGGQVEKQGESDRDGRAPSGGPHTQRGHHGAALDHEECRLITSHAASGNREQEFVRHGRNGEGRERRPNGMVQTV
jgi:hypothetical protein